MLSSRWPRQKDPLKRQHQCLRTSPPTSNRSRQASIKHVVKTSVWDPVFPSSEPNFTDYQALQHYIRRRQSPGTLDLRLTVGVALHPCRVRVSVLTRLDARQTDLFPRPSSSTRIGIPLHVHVVLPSNRVRSTLLYGQHAYPSTKVDSQSDIGGIPSDATDWTLLCI